MSTDPRWITVPRYHFWAQWFPGEPTRYFVTTYSRVDGQLVATGEEEQPFELWKAWREAEGRNMAWVSVQGDARSQARQQVLHG